MSRVRKQAEPKSKRYPVPRTWPNPHYLHRSSTRGGLLHGCLAPIVAPLLCPSSSHTENAQIRKCDKLQANPLPPYDLQHGTCVRCVVGARIGTQEPYQGARFTLESLGPVRSKEARDALIGVEWSRSAGTQRFHIEEPGFGNQSSAVVGMGGSGMCLSAPAYPFELHSHGQIASRRGVVGPPLTSVDAISAELNCVTEIGLRMRWLVGHAV